METQFAPFSHRGFRRSKPRPFKVTSKRNGCFLMVFPSLFTNSTSFQPPLPSFSKAGIEFHLPHSMYCKHLGSSDLQPFADRICFRRLHHLMRAFANQLLTIYHTQNFPPSHQTNNHPFFFKKKPPKYRKQNPKSETQKFSKIWYPK